jgi:protein LTV1
MQHLKPVGLREDGVESILIEAPSVQKEKSKAGKSQTPIHLVDDLPAEVLPSKQELPRNYESQEAIPSSIAGFQPDMDPHLRQTLEALEDEAFVDGGLEDDFFGELVADGERGSGEEPGFEFSEWSVGGGEEGGPPHNEGEEADPEDWQVAVKRFKQAQQTRLDDADSDVDGYSEGGDTVGSIPQFSVIGGKKRRKGSSEASGYSMTSSSMFRNAGLTMIDEQFDQVCGFGELHDLVLTRISQTDRERVCVRQGEL